jgi:hypothetical protein
MMLLSGKFLPPYRKQGGEATALPFRLFSSSFDQLL